MDDSVKSVRDMARNFADAKVRCVLYPQKRPSFMKQMKVSLKDYEATGFIDYDTELAKQIHPDDADYIEQYAEDMRTVWVIEHGLSLIRNPKTRAIAEDTLIKGQSCDELVEKYGMNRSSIYRRKADAMNTIARIVLPGE